MLKTGALWRRLYTLIWYGLAPILLWRTVWRSRLDPRHRAYWKERLGWVRQRNTQRPCIWLHAVSVGETMAARPLIERLLVQYPKGDIWITSTTLTGRQTVQRLWGARVLQSYLCYDLPSAVKRFLQRVQPHLVLIMETELWPNLYQQCARQQLPLILINARLSTRSYRGYARLRPLMMPTVQTIRLIAARSAEDADHFMALGAKPEHVRVAGNIKFDLTIAPELTTKAQQLRATWGSERPIWVAASTHSGEDEVVLSVFTALKQTYPDLLLVLVPRHPERFAAVVALCQASHWRVVQRSQSPTLSSAVDIIVGDTMGELALWYALADMAFIGGSLGGQGGHNPLEACVFKVAVVSGRAVHNFADIYPALAQAGGAVLVDDSAQLMQQLHTWLQNPALRQAAGQAGFTWLQPNRGVVERLTQWIDEVWDEQR